MAAFDGAEMIDVVGPLEVFSVASRILAYRGEGMAPGQPAYRVEIVAEHSGPLRMESGLQILAARSLRSFRGPVDTVIVPGGDGVSVTMHRPRYMSWLERTAATSRRVASVCTGARVLAAAGLLKGRRATTHWRFCDVLAAENPDIRIEPDSIFVRDENVWTSAGVTAGMDLALAMVEEDHGRHLALAAARMMVIFLKRPGGQSQFSAQLASQLAEREPLRDLQTWIVDHPDEDLRVELLARRAGMSPRNFARAFARETGMTPARFVEQVRLGAARRRLEDTTSGVDQIAESCGFGTAETMRRAFLRGLAINPSAYRARFRTEREHGNHDSAV
ncbi:MAG TPA: DJ-1/PfpI family protein [Candidatus Limnocylindrales bacterium]|nr:DJ-1/PfpI family protein [Candidatus Limnocylindrales bacterium]